MVGSESLKNIISHCKANGFVFQSSEIYDGLGAVYDYGPYGIELKKNLSEYWWKSMTQVNDNIVGLDSAIFMHPSTWKASGHIDAFNDPLIDNKDSKKRYRADTLIEDYLAKIQSKIDKDIKKAKKRFGDNFDEGKFINTSDRIIKYKNDIKKISSSLSKSLKENDLNALKNWISYFQINDQIF